jgi:hypothetical protein
MIFLKEIVVNAGKASDCTFEIKGPNQFLLSQTITCSAFIYQANWGSVRLTG